MNKILAMNLLGGMHDFILNEVGDEEATDTWLTYGVPDEATEEDLEEIARDLSNFKEICSLFGNLVKDYL